MYSILSKVTLKPNIKTLLTDVYKEKLRAVLIHIFVSLELPRPMILVMNSVRTSVLYYQCANVG